MIYETRKERKRKSTNKTLTSRNDIKNDIESDNNKIMDYYKNDFFLITHAHTHTDTLLLKCM